MSRLLENSEQYRKELIGKNIFTNNDQYNVSHSRALSDGDVHGKGETDTIGSSDDIKKRDELLGKNIYGKDNPYDLSNA